MTNKEISALLEEIARALELVSDNPFKAKAYLAAARVVESHPDPIAQVTREGKLSGLKGIGTSVAGSITDIVATGTSPLLSELLNEIPPDVWRMLSLPGLGPKRVKKIWRALGVSTLNDLEKACNEGRLLTVGGFGDKTQASILKGIELLRRSEGRLLLSAAHQIAMEFTETLADSIQRRDDTDSERTCLEIAGELRRQCETVGPIEILAAATSAKDVQDVMAALGKIGDCEMRPAEMHDCESLAIAGQDEIACSTKTRFRGVSVVLHIRPPCISVRSLFLLTGNRAHVDECEQLCPQLFADNREFVNEQEIYSALNMSYIPPEMREGTGEVECARNAELPHLIEDQDIKGILHVHTNYSDGSNSIEEIARYCRDKGYEYVGISDHSRSAFYAGGLSPSDLMRQRDEIRKVRLRLPDIKVLHGIESDILADGSLDYDDDLLAILDFVIGSVHSKFSMSRDDMTSRVIAAVRNPYLSILGHPTGRLLLSRDRYQIDLEAVLQVLEEEGKAVELNADPHRLDLDWRHCKIAKRRRIPVSINPDAHDIKGIENTRFGVSIGRKGWLSKADVLNCLDAHEIVVKLESMRRA